MTIDLSLTPQLEEMVRQKVSSGLYSSVSEVVCEALRLMKTQDRLQAIKLEQLRQDIQDGLESGEPTPWSREEIEQAGRQQKISRTSSNVTTAV
jgi:antitoxin ParD1/3/4